VIDRRKLREFVDDLLTGGVLRLRCRGGSPFFASERLARVFKALADPTWVKLLSLIAAAERTTAL
jgi:hypothetical protein